MTERNSEAVDFLLALRRTGPWLLTAIVPDGPTTTETATSPQEVDRFVAKYDGRQNLYYSVNPTKRSMRKKPAKTDILHAEYAHVDIDPVGDETSDAAKARGLAALEGFDKPPTIVVDSGNGIQALWRLDRPATVEQIEAVNRALADRLGGDKATWNADRILRLPGTRNLPTQKKREKGRVECQSRLIAVNASAYPLAAFDTASADTAPASKTSRKASTKASRSSAIGATGDTPDLDYVVKTGDATHWEGDRSKAVWFFVNESLRRGVPRDDIVETLLDRENGISEHVRAQTNPRQYAQRQAAKAAKTLDKEAANYPRVERVEITRGGSEGDPALWTLFLAGGAKLILSSDDVFNQRVFLRRCFALLGRAYARQRDVTYTAWINALAASATWIEPPAVASVEAEFHEWLEDYLTQFSGGVDYARPKEDLHLRPWEDEANGRYLFRLKFFHSHLRQQGSRFGQESRQMLSDRICRMGGRSFDTTLPGGQTLAVYSVPSALFRKTPVEVPPPKKRESPF